MSIFCSATTGGFYPDDMRSDYLKAGTWPADAVELTASEYAELRDGLDAGLSIKPDSNGRPVLIGPQPLTLEQIKATRLSAYRDESDALKIEADHDAILYGTQPDYTAWMAKVAEIKARYPLPE